MRTLITLGLSTLPLLACQEFSEPIALPPYGAAVRQNMQAQIVNPLPPPPGIPVADAARQVLATERYRTDTVEAPTAATTTDVTPVAQ